MRPGLTDDEDTVDAEGGDGDGNGEGGGGDGATSSSMLITPAPTNPIPLPDVSSLPETRDTGIIKPGPPASVPLTGNLLLRPLSPVAQTRPDQPTRPIPIPGAVPSGPRGGRLPDGYVPSDPGSVSDLNPNSNSNSNSHSSSNSSSSSERRDSGSDDPLPDLVVTDPSLPPTIHLRRLPQDALLRPTVPLPPALTLQFARRSGPHVEVFAPTIKPLPTRPPRVPHVWPPLLPITEHSTMDLNHRFEQNPAELETRTESDSVNEGSPVTPVSVQGAGDQLSMLAQLLLTDEPRVPSPTPALEIPPGSAPPGLIVEDVWLDPFAYQLIIGFGDRNSGEIIGDEKNDAFANWFVGQYDVWGPLQKLIGDRVFLDSDARPLPLATFTEPFVFHIAFHRIDVHTDEFDGYPVSRISYHYARRSEKLMCHSGKTLQALE